MQYNLTQHGALRTPAYKGTITDYCDPAVYDLRAAIKKHNKELRAVRKTNPNSYEARQPTMRLIMMARGTRRDAQGILLHPNADSCLQKHLGTSWDVYIHQNREL